MNQRAHYSTLAGKVTVLTVLVGIVFSIALFFLGGKTPWQHASASNSTATTSVTVLNTPPVWTVDAQEQTESSTSTPTNAGGVVTWIGTATDANADPYYLLICKSSTTPTANAGAAPSCGGGIANQWNVSAQTTSGSQATVSTTTTASMSEVNYWIAWVCDNNAITPRCNATYKEGTYPTASPFEVNHRPSFSAIVDDSPTLPGAVATFTATASDADVSGTADTVRLFICKANDFTGTYCGAGGTYGTSTFSASNPATSTTIVIPSQDKNYTAYAFVLDNHGFAASGGAQGTDSVLTVSNATSTVSAATISLNDTDLSGSLTLTTENGQTTGFSVKYTVTDNNSCLNASSGNEIRGGLVSVFRESVGSTSCQTSGNYNAANCYPSGVATTTWNVVCTQDASTCSGATDLDANWTCTFPLWNIADPTDGTTLTDSPYFAQEWKATASAIDDNYATSTYVQGTTGNELLSFLAYNLSTLSIAYGSLQAGQQNDPLFATTTMQSTGNVGLDESLYGDNMCTTYPTPYCKGYATSTIPMTSQRYATSTVSFASGTALTASTSPVEVEVNVQKSTTTTWAATKDTYWGINIPSAITLAGDYLGQNTFIGVKGEAQQW